MGKQATCVSQPTCYCLQKMPSLLKARVPECRALWHVCREDGGAAWTETLWELCWGVRSCEGECDSSHAVAGPAEKNLRARFASADWEGGVLKPVVVHFD